MSSNVVKLGDICKIGSSKRIKRDDYVENGIPFFRSKEIIELSKGNSISTELFIAKDQYNQINEKFGSPDTGDILITSVGTLGVAYQVEQSQLPFYFKDGNLTWLSQFSEDVNPRWVLYWLNSPEGQRKIDEISIGSTQRAITIVALKSIEVQLPHKDEQDRTVKILDSVTGKISTNNKTNQTLEQIAQAIFKSWFVDFDPVKAKIEALAAGGSANDAELAAMGVISAKTLDELNSLKARNPEAFNKLAQTAALFPAAMQDSELGDIPEGWECGALGDICTFTAGSAFKPEYQGSTEGDYPFIKVSDMNLAGNEVFIQSANNYVSKAQQSEMKAKLHTLGATVFAKIGVALTSNRRRLLTTSTIIDNNMMSASPIDETSGQYFLYSLLCTIDFNTLASGTALPYLNVSDLKKIPIVRPSSVVFRAFELNASSIFSMMQTLAVQSSTLSLTRDTLLPNLLSSELIGG